MNKSTDIYSHNNNITTNNNINQHSNSNKSNTNNVNTGSKFKLHSSDNKDFIYGSYGSGSSGAKTTVKFIINQITPLQNDRFFLIVTFIMTIPIIINFKIFKNKLK